MFRYCHHLFYRSGGCKIDDDIDHSVNQLNVFNDFEIFITQLSSKTTFDVVLSCGEEVNRGNTLFFYIVC